MKSPQDVVIVSLARSPIGDFGGSLMSVRAYQLAAQVIQGVLAKVPGLDPALLEDVILGDCCQAPDEANTARTAALAAGIPQEVPAVTIQRQCSSAMQAMAQAAMAIQSGHAEIILAGGVESMSNAPYLLRQGRTGYRLGHGEVTDCLVADGLTDAYDGLHMGFTAELVASEYHVERQAMDEYSVQSHRKAAAAWAAGKFDAETFPVPLPQKKGDPIPFRADEGIRADVTLEALAKLRPAFKKDGVVTAGNASQISDGGAAVVVTTASVAQKKGVAPLGRIVAYATAGLEPKWVMMTPEPAVRAAAAKAGWDLKSVDLFELNEAFAAQSCVLLKVLDLPAEKVNVNGGAVALGHPIGASGARCLLTLLYAMKDRGAKRGIVSLCLGGGNGVAMAIEAV